MSISIIELNDSEIRIASDSEIVLQTPGYAVLKPDSLLLGDEAVRVSHLHPRETNNRFWNNLNQDALPVQSPHARHNADLAYQQLLAIHEEAGKPEGFIFSVPGNYTEEQLSLLLGIVEACPFAAAGLVDTGVAAAAAVAGRGEYVHVDIHLHQSIVTFLSVGDKVTRERVQIIDDCGLTDIHDTCAAFIADLFIQQSRFDPLHHAETEQSLYDQIAASLAAFKGRNEVNLEVRYEQTRHQVRVYRDPLLAAVDRHYARILESLNGVEATLLIGDRLHALPGFMERIPKATSLAPESVFHGIHQNLTEVHAASGPPLSFITRLPACPAPSVTPGPTPENTASVRPQPRRDPAVDVTHLLIDHQAVPLGPSPLYLSADGRIETSPRDDSHCSVTKSDEGVLVKQQGELSLFVNGLRIDGQSHVGAGDTLGFAGSDTTYRFIHVSSA